MLKNQQNKFSLDPDVSYINHAYMAPQLNSVSAIGIENLRRKERPNTILGEHFFEEKEVLRSRFAQLIDAPDKNNIAIIPSVSYGVATALRNIPFDRGDTIIVLEEQFPSNFYAWKELESSRGVQIKTILSPKLGPERAANWSTEILESIDTQTKAIAIPIVHWSDGTLFNIKEIKARAQDVGAYLIIDGTQSIGALPFSVSQIKPDALICGGYKWLMGPYSLGVAYYGERFENGSPIENNWMNHQGSENFANLVNYNLEFKPKSIRYDVGESSNFILTPMLSEGIRQVLEWSPAAIQEYCNHISTEAISRLSSHGYFIEHDRNRGHHLFGIYLDSGEALNAAKVKIQQAKVSVSYRGKSIRVAPHLYCSKEDMTKLASCLID